MASPASADDVSCTGVAPATSFCTTGSHVRGGEHIRHGPDLEASALFTGTIVSYLVSGSGNVKRSCDIVLGEQQPCRTEAGSTWPKVGESFDHRCFAYTLGSDRTPLGVGPWGCFVEHS